MRDDEDYDPDRPDGNEPLDPKRADAARELFSRYKKDWQQEQNVTYGKQLEITILELHIHELVEEQIAAKSVGATRVAWEVEDLISELIKGARR